MAVQESRLVISIDAKNAERTAKALNSELQGITNNGAKADNQINAMGGSLKALAGYMGGILTIGSAIAMADGYTQMAARIRNATSSAQEYELVQERILETANGTYRSLSEAQEVYLSLAGGMKSLGKTTADTLDVADSLSYAFVANAARADQAQSAMDALSKSMAKGKIDADAWISIVSAADNVIADMAKTTGKTEAEIRKLGAEGKASLTDLLETLKATRDTNKQLADNMENSVADGFQKLTNSVTVYLGKLNETSGATGTIAAALGGLGDNIDKVAVAGGILASVMAGRVASGYAAATISAIANTSATAASAGAMATATAAARALYIALGGPVGLAVTVAGAAASYLLLSNNAKDNTKSLRENNEAVNDAIQKYRELDDVQKRAQQAAEKSKLSELAESYKELTDDLNTNAYALSRHNDFTREQSREVNALIAEFKKTGDLDKFSSSINKLSYISQDSKDKFNALAGQVRASGNEYKNQKQFVDAMTNSLNQNAAAGDNAARGVRNAAEAVAEYTGKLKQQKWDLEFTNAVIDKHGKSAREADLLLQAYRENEKKGIKGVTVEQKELIKGIVAEEKAAQKRLESQRASASASKKAQSEADKARKKQENDNNRLIEQQAQLRDSIQDTFDTEFEQIQRREAYALKDLEAAGFKPDEYKKYSEIIKNEYQAQRDEYLKNLSIELNEYTWTEDYKLEYAYKTDKAILENSNRTNGILKERQLKYLDERYAYEKAQLELAKETRIFQAEQAMYSEIDLIQKRYELEQRKIIETAGIADDERKRLLAALEADTKQQRADKTIGIMTNYQNAIGINTSADTAFIERQKAIDAAYENGLIKQKEYEEQSKLSAMQYQADLATIRLGGMEQIAGGLGEILKGMAGEQSAAYKAMFAIEKGFAIAQAGLAIQTGVSRAIALGFPQNIPVIAQTVMEGAKIMSAIKAIQGNGFYNGGYTGNAGRNQVAGVVHGQEYVLNAEATKRVGRGTLDALNNGGTIGGNVKVEPRITINVPQGYTARQSVNDNGDVTVDIVEKFVVGELSNPSSKISKSMKQNFNITDRR